MTEITITEYLETKWVPPTEEVYYSYDQESQDPWDLENDPCDIEIDLDECDPRIAAQLIKIYEILRNKSSY